MLSPTRIGTLLRICLRQLYRLKPQRKTLAKFDRTRLAFSVKTSYSLYEAKQAVPSWRETITLNISPLSADSQPYELNARGFLSLGFIILSLGLGSLNSRNRSTNVWRCILSGRHIYRAGTHAEAKKRKGQGGEAGHT